MSESKEIKDEIITQGHSRKIMLSFSLTSAAMAMLPNVVFAQLPMFYETEILLPMNLMFFAYILFTIWDAFNDLLAGSLTDRTTRLTKRWGKRFPWILITSIPFCFTLIMLFSPPDMNIVGVAGVFLWYIIGLLIFDGFFSFWSICFQALSTDKFRSDEERTKLAGYMAATATLGGGLGATIAPLFIIYGDPSSYVNVMIWVGLIGLVLVLLSIPGVRESKEMIERALNAPAAQRDEKTLRDLFNTMKHGFRNKNFVGFICYMIGSSVFVALFLPSIAYYVRYVLNEPAAVQTLLLLPYLLAGILPIPFFIWITNKVGHIKSFKVTILILPLSLVPLLFAQDLITVMISGMLIGAFTGLHGIVYAPIMGDLIDEASIKNERRVDGSYYAIIIFIMQAGQLIQYLTFWLLHDVFTDFDPTAQVQSPLAIWGIRVQIALVPIIALYIGVFIFLNLWSITPEKVISFKKQLKELDI